MRLHFTLLAIFSSIFLQAQIKGKVIDSEGQAVGFASVVLQKAADSSTVEGTVTNFEGHFELKSKPGDYIFRIQFLSYKPYTEKISVERKGQLVDMGTITLESAAVILKGVEVQAERSQMVMKLDKRIFNVGTDLTSRGGSASDILDNVPSVNVDVEGNISLRGSRNVRILIDGKPSALIRSGGQALRQIPAHMIESVEVITNPSARYEAEGETGIINIVLKKEKEKSLNGSFEASTGYPGNHGLNYTLNWRNENFGITSSYGILYRKFEGGGELRQEFYDPDEADYTSERNHERGGLNHNIRLGMDWNAGRENTFGVTGFYNIGRNQNRALLDYQFLDENGSVIQKVERDDDENEDRDIIELELRHEKVFGDKDHKWTSSINFNRRDDKEDNKITESSNTMSDVLQRVDNREDAQTIIVKSDFTYPFAGEGLFETGVFGSFRDIENEFTVLEGNNENDLKVLSNFDNLFQYDEDIYAAYVMAGNKSGSLSYQAGLRLEHSEIITDLVKTNERNPRSYTNLFPSGLLAWEVDSTQNIQLSYSRRITRPRLWYLFPFFTFSDNRNLASGNPNLDPEFTHALELSYLKKVSKGSLMASLVYRHSTGVIERINLLFQDGITRWFPVNIATRDAYGMEFNADIDVNRWLQITGNVYAAYEELKGAYEDVDLSVNYFNLTSRLGTEFDLGKHTDFQINFRYNSPVNTAQGRQKHIARVDLALSQRLFDNRGNLTLSVSDLFNSRVRRRETITRDYFQYSEFQWRARQINITLNYRIEKNG